MRRDPGSKTSYTRMLVVTVGCLVIWVASFWWFGLRELLGIGAATARFRLTPRVFVSLGIPLALIGFWLMELARRVRIEVNARRYRRYVRRVTNQRR
jgi:hypothetical protein